MAKQRTAIVPTRDEDYAEWYQQVVKESELAENSPVRGCMVIKPWGYALWENIQSVLDGMFKATGHTNAYFPLFIPKSYLEKEAKHVDGFAKECAVVTHHRLEEGEDGTLVPAGELDEPLIVRPTSETIIGEMYSKWVQSHRDLPILINQWANVVRWEMRTRLFLRTTEFLWQEGHTAHETKQEAWDETVKMLDVYKQFAEEYLAVPVITGEKSESERFPGAVNTLCIEAMMQDRKALQAGTSHFLGQNFSKSFDISFQGRDEKNQYAWTTSWGVSTRLVGALIMTHSDDDGLIIPPRLAPDHVVILPIIRKEEDREKVLAYCDELNNMLSETQFDGKPVRVRLDSRDMNAGEKGWSWVKKGIPIRVEIGPRDIEQNSVFIARRDKGPREKFSLTREQLAEQLPSMLEDMQKQLFLRAQELRNSNTRQIDSYDEFSRFFTPGNPKKPEVHGGFAYSHWCGSPECEAKVKEDLKVTIRCIPFDQPEEKGVCVSCGESSDKRVLWAKSY